MYNSHLEENGNSSPFLRAPPLTRPLDRFNTIFLMCCARGRVIVWSSSRTGEEEEEGGFGELCSLLPSSPLDTDTGRVGIKIAREKRGIQRRSMKVKGREREGGGSGEGKRDDGKGEGRREGKVVVGG